MKTAFQILSDIEHAAGAAGFTMADVCREAGIHQAQVSRWKAKVSEPRLSGLQRLEDALAALSAQR